MGGEKIKGVSEIFRGIKKYSRGGGENYSVALTNFQGGCEIFRGC